MEDIFERGDVVVLKSGGDLMTVEAIGGMGFQVRCVWFDKNNELHRAWFDDEVLEKIPTHIRYEDAKPIDWRMSIIIISIVAILCIIAYCAGNLIK